MCHSTTRGGYTKLLSLEELQSALHCPSLEVTINSYTYLEQKAPWTQTRFSSGNWFSLCEANAFCCGRADSCRFPRHRNVSCTVCSSRDWVHTLPTNKLPTPVWIARLKEQKDVITVDFLVSFWYPVLTKVTVSEVVILLQLQRELC